MTKKQKLYVGTRGPTGCAVTVIHASGFARPLDPRVDLFNHSPDGFEWGYSGSGPAQLALAILADHFGSTAGDERAVELHQEFKRQVVAALGGDAFRVPESVVEAWLRNQAAPAPLGSAGARVRRDAGRPR